MEGEVYRAVPLHGPGGSQVAERSPSTRLGALSLSKRRRHRFGFPSPVARASCPCPPWIATPCGLAMTGKDRPTLDGHGEESSTKPSRGGMERRVKRESESGGKSLEAAGNVGVQSGVVVVLRLPCRRPPYSPLYCGGRAQCRHRFGFPSPVARASCPCPPRIASLRSR
jgi:hypothetical protein